ncbi:MAG: Gfo/Idh/MocA family oxidoreductase [Pseudomonadota bacterium]
MIPVAVLGAGIGREHLAGYRALPGRFTVKWVIDLDTARAYTILDGDTGPQVSDDVAVALSDPEIALIDICLPPHLHVPIAIRALETGKHVIVEKPMAASLADCDALAAAEAKGTARVFPVFQYRFGPATAALDALIEAGLVGTPQVASVETHWNRGLDYYAVPWRGTWKGEMGGAVLGHAIHNHDLLMRYFGDVAHVQAVIDTRINPIETEDCAAISLRFANGALASSSVTLGAAANTSRLNFVFEGLTATSGSEPYAPATGGWTFTARDPADQGQVDWVVARQSRASVGFAGYLSSVADAIAGDTTNAVTLQDGRRSVELVSAIYAAASRGAGLSLPLAPDVAIYKGWQPE